MKIAQQFRAFIELHHFLVLPKIGRFETISADANPQTGEIDKWLIRFLNDPQAQPDKELTGFISRNLKIETCVAESDLNSFCNSIKELFIQGFEAEIPGIGFLHLDSKNQLKFSVNSMYNPIVNKSRKRPAALFSSSFWL